MEHKHKTFHLELSELRTMVGRMGELVIDQLERALVCLKEHNVRDARIVTERDINVNRMDIDLEEMCLQFLALHQPVAGDLRFITAAMKITTELERIGDRVVDICNGVHQRGGRDPVESHPDIPRLGALAAAMMRDSVTAFSSADISLAKKVFQRDKEFDALCCEVFSRFMTSANEPRGHDTMLAFLSKDLNEISEHATNIAEVVMFMVEGKQLSHVDMHERRPRSD
jgi:phosphate transport system protein